MIPETKKLQSWQGLRFLKCELNLPVVQEGQHPVIDPGDDGFQLRLDGIEVSARVHSFL